MATNTIPWTDNWQIKAIEFKLQKKFKSYRNPQGKQLSNALPVEVVSQDGLLLVHPKKGESYRLVNAESGSLIQPARIAQYGRHLEITLEDSQTLRMVDFFSEKFDTTLPGDFQIANEFVFSSGQISLPVWIIDSNSNLEQWEIGSAHTLWPSQVGAGLPDWLNLTGLYGYSGVNTAASVGALSDTMNWLLVLGGGCVVGLLAAGGGDVSRGTPIGPVFTSGVATTVPEGLSVSEAVYRANAKSDGSTSITRYTLTGPDAKSFQIDSATGAVYFLLVPDADLPSDLTANNVYQFTVTAWDGLGQSVSQGITVRVLDIPDQKPVFVSGSAIHVTENLEANNAVYVAVATPDVSGGVVRYALAGTDAGMFRIDAITGLVRFIHSPNFEYAEDISGAGSVAGDNVYDLKIIASEWGGLTATQLLSISVHNVADQAPQFVSTANVQVYENVPTSSTIYTTIAVPDLQGDQLIYSLSGTDASAFAINAATGAIKFNTSPNFEMPTDSAGGLSIAADNVYDILITATDSHGLSQSQFVQFRVLDVGSTLNFVSPPAVHIFENTVDPAYTAAAHVDLVTTTVYSLIPIADASLFTIDSATGEVRFLQSPDFEVPLDSTLSNVYKVVVHANNAGQTADQEISVTVDDVVGVQPTPITLALNGATNLDVQSNLVVDFNVPVLLSTDPTLQIHVIHESSPGFHADAAWNASISSHQRDFSVNLLDASQVSLSTDGLHLRVNPLGDLDFGSTYHLAIDAGAFVSRSDPSSTPGSVAITSGLARFSTVSPSASTLGAKSQLLSDQGNLLNGQTYVDIEGLGNNEQVNKDLNLFGDTVTLVYKDYDPASGTPTVSGIGAGVTAFNLQALGFGADDQIYFDDQSCINALSANNVLALGGLGDPSVFNTPSSGNLPNIAGVIQLDPAFVGANHGWLGLSLEVTNPGYRFDLSHAVISG